MNEAAHAFTQGAERNAAFIASTPQGRRQAWRRWPSTPTTCRPSSS